MTFAQMKMRPGWLIVGGLILCTAVGSAVGQSLYMYRNLDGSIAFTDAPAARGFDQRELTGRRPGAPAAAAVLNEQAASAPAADPTHFQAIEEQRRVSRTEAANAPHHTRQRAQETSASDHNELSPRRASGAWR